MKERERREREREYREELEQKYECPQKREERKEADGVVWKIRCGEKGKYEGTETRQGQENGYIGERK